MRALRRLIGNRDIASIAVALALLATACAPVYPPLHLRPQERHSDWVRGMEYVHGRANGIRVFLAFDHSTREHVVFDIEIANHGDSSVAVRPETFALVVEARAQRLGAIDPESRIQALDRKRAQVESAHESGRTLDAIVTLAGGLLRGLSRVLGSPPADPDPDQAAYNADLEAQREQDEARHRQRLVDIAVERALWAGEALRRTDLGADETVRGFVFFPRVEDAGLVRLLLEVGPERFQFEFAPENLVAEDDATRSERCSPWLHAEGSRPPTGADGIGARTGTRGRPARPLGSRRSASRP